MCNLFKQKSETETIQLNVSGIDLENDHEVIFYEFVTPTTNYIRERCIKKCKEMIYEVSPILKCR